MRLSLASLAMLQRLAQRIGRPATGVWLLSASFALAPLSTLHSHLQGVHHHYVIAALVASERNITTGASLRTDFLSFASCGR